ncbi:Phosphoserine phosphatase SerB2 [Gracilariopsis chorda]|uniref:phosphoserine phosphatase n=1 Tax=Gracilariopsis chorda TaxID=448386 RepID=A0A2V3IT67_9FLOR|nr:Phosphoserine phosphatase SerB2 [Gracilariopsis chorda]|eukprot:PXF45304.1 Phosphoserine phosphatase SerB2 [Gracilariopsis chorda]
MTSTENVIVTLSGKQSPGALASVMHVLSTDDAHLIDFGQIVVRNRFIATALISTKGAHHTIKEILLRAHKAAIHVHFNVANQPHSRSTTSLSHYQHHNDHFILTVFSPSVISPHLLAKLTHSLLNNDARIVAISPLTDETDAFMCLEMTITLADQTVLPALQRQLFELGRTETHCDLALQRANVSRKAKRMVVFDLSWTLVQCDAINVLLHAADVQVPPAEEHKFRTGAMSGVEWLQLRVKLLKGLNAHSINQKAIQNMVYTNGAVQLCKGLKRLGCKLALVSSGSIHICQAVQQALSLDFVFGNVLEVDTAGCFTGTVKHPVIDTQRKAELVAMLAMQERIDTEQIIAVGDGPVSSKMLASVGMSIAFDQPDAVDAVHSGRIGSKSLASVLYLLGVSGHDFRTVTAH